jgi:hypothetical protein
MLSKPLGLNWAGLTAALNATGTRSARDAIPPAQAFATLSQGTDTSGDKNHTVDILRGRDVSAQSGRSSRRVASSLNFRA